MAIAFHHDFFVPRESAIHLWPAQPKVLCLMGMMFSIALVTQWVLLPWILIGVMGLYLYAQLPLSYLRRRLPYPGIFILATVVLLPFTSGQMILWQWSGLLLRQEGLETAILIAGRFLSIMTLGFILLGSTPFLEVLGVMRSLKIPPLLTDMALLTYRYLFDVAEQFATMRQAMALRGYGRQRQSLLRQWTWLSSLFGSLLVRSYDQSQRVYQAMRLRGYGQGSCLHQRQTRSQGNPPYLTGGAIALTVCLITAEWILSH
jgi:cobalt/nickel transport system permease protein